GERLARRDRKGDATQDGRLGHPPGADAQIADIEEVRAVHAQTSRFLRRGLSASFSPSPTRLSASAVIRRAAPGMAMMYHASRIWPRPMPIIVPQVITLGSPKPRKDSADSIRIAVAISTLDITVMEESALGRIW